ncbi:uncharacterized protein J3D65DRAFT_618391 [Phyllosticta citribraziliensis]|uniref:DUF7924 domain-containing protein n=1 Tax=Phyllosticta citribraziliensis TaxID=989973 RepID=A0ABR1LVZ2_9PEZI
MAPARSSPSSSGPKSLRGCQSDSPRRSARLQSSSSPSALKGAFDRPETRETAESIPLDPPTEQGAGRKRKRNEDIDQAVECSSVPPKEQGTDRKRKRSEDTERPVEQILRPLERSSPVKNQELEAREREAGEQEAGEEETSQNARKSLTLEPDDEAAPQSYFTGTWYEARDPVDHWVNHDVWPPNFAESNEPEPEIEPESENEPEEMSTLSRTPSARRQAKNRFSKEVWDIELPQAEINAPNTPDTRARLLKSQCVIDYWTKHSKMPKDGLTKSAEETCRRVLESSQTGPPRDADYFRRVSKRLQSKGETKVVQDIGPLVAPRVEPLYFGGDDSLEYLTESVDETWSLCVPILGPHPPRPDYAAGFHREIAFTERQLSVLKRFGNGEDDSLVRVTKSLSFPFFSFEAKAGGVDLAEAEQQNVEDALIASRGVIELFKRANLAHEIDREILAFSVVYNDHEVRIFAHFADVQRSHPRFYRHQIDQKLISQADCATHKMVNYIYKVWAREHWERICRAIDTLATRPGYTPSTSSQASVSVSGNRTPQSGSMGPPSEPRSASVPPLAPRPTSASNNVRSQRDLTPNTSPTRDTKKPKKSGYS